MATSAYNSVLKPVYEQALKPAYEKVLKPALAPIGRIASKAASVGEHFIEGGLDFSEKFVDKARGGALNLEDGAFNITKLLSNPFVMIGAGILGLVVVSKL